MEEHKHIYIMGICGTAMGSLAGLLKELGHDVRGSDQNVYPPMSLELKKLGIPVALGFYPKNLEPRPDLVIVGNVMTKVNPEVQALLRTDIPYMSLPEAMGKYLINDRHSIVVSGTHGKTTTTAAAAWVLSQAGVKPGYMVGGIPVNLPRSFSVGEGDYFVIEGDEYDTAFFDKVPKFIHYRPKSVILTSIEFDHADIYKNLDDVKAAFARLLPLIPADGCLIYRGEDHNVQDLLKMDLLDQSTKTISYGMKDAHWTIGSIQWGEQHSQFDVFYRGRKEETITAQLFGDYNLLNLLAVYALGRELGLPQDKLLEALATYRGVKRRQEILGTSKQGVTVIDDFAHHPTAVALTLKGVRERFPKRRIVAAFEPRSATSRRNIFQKEFARALAEADHVVLSAPYDQSKIPESERLNIEALCGECEALKSSSAPFIGRDVDTILDHLHDYCESGDVIVLMSNGGFGGIYDRILSAL